jgi:soluble lytic murein transglycosylase
MIESDHVVWTQEEQLARAQAQLAQGDAAGCLATLAEVTAESLAQRVALTRGQALLTRGRDTEALADLELASTGPSPSVAADAVMAQARRLMRLGDNAGARKAFQRVDTTWPKDHDADEAGYLAAWLAMNSGELDAAVTDFAAFERNHPNSRRLDEARWFRAFSLLKLSRLAEAREVARTIAVDFPKSSLVPQALYWATRASQLEPAKASVDAGVVIDIEREYRELAEAFPRHLVCAVRGRAAP